MTLEEATRLVMGKEPFSVREVKTGKGDGEMLDWVLQHAGRPLDPWDIQQWSAYSETRTADTIQAKERVLKNVTAMAPHRADILTGFDLLDLDDYFSFGGKP